MGRKIYKGAQAIGTGPWYCSTLSPKVHHYMGGLETNSKGQVIDVSSEKPIPGLYAAGVNPPEAYTVPLDLALAQCLLTA